MLAAVGLLYRTYLCVILIPVGKEGGPYPISIQEYWYRRWQ